jgi:hypothetical protein
MPATPLATPFNVTTALSPDKSKITVKWDDKNAATDVSKYDVSFLAKDTLLPFVPPTATVGVDTPTGTGTISHSVDIIPAAGTSPTAAELESKYVAQVIARAKDTTTHSDSAPGLQVYWDSNLSLIVQVGSHSFTLTKASSLSGVYRLPVSRTNPFTITLDDVKSFADAVGVGSNNVPTSWPNGDPITGGLSLYKLAVDTDRKLMALDIAFTLNFTPIPGLTVQEVGLSVVRTDGVNPL